VLPRNTFRESLYLYSACQGQHEVPNVCPNDCYQLSEAARRTLRRMRRRPRLITAFWQQASLWPE